MFRLLIAKYISLHLSHENSVPSQVVLLTYTDWDSSLFSVPFSLTGLWLKSWGQGGWSLYGSKGIRALSQLQRKQKRQLGKAETSFPTSLGGPGRPHIDPRVWIPCVSFLLPLSHQGGVGIGGVERVGREIKPQGLLC